MVNMVFFLSSDVLKERTTIDLNVEDKILDNSILDAQEIDLQNVIGTRLYNRLKTDVMNNSVTGTYKTLLDDYIFYFLLKYAQRRALLYMWVKFRNKGLMQQNSENSQPVDLSIFDKVRGEILNDCEFYSNRLKLFLMDYQDSLIEYRDWNNDNKLSNMNPDINNSYFSGLHLEPANTYRNTWMSDFEQSKNNGSII